MCKMKVLVLACVFPLMFCGCYDNREVDTVATVMAVGIEKVLGTNEKNYTFALSDTGGYTSDSEGDAATLVCYTAPGKDIESAIYELDKKISKALSFSHLSAIFFSKEAASENMYSDARFFEQNYKVRPQVILALCEMSPQKYLEGLSPRLESNPEKYFRSIFQKSRFYIPALRLCDFTDSYHCRETLPIAIISGSEYDGKISGDNFEFSSVGIISRGKLVAEMNNRVFHGLFFSRKRVKYGENVLKCINKPKVSVKLKDGKAKVHAALDVKADKSVSKAHIAASLEEIAKEYAQREIDVINIFRYAKKNFFTLKGYEEINRNEILKNADFEFKVNIVKGDL